MQRKRYDSLDKKVAKEFIDSLSHPYCYLDFETASPEILRLETSCNLPIPFQYSLSIERHSAVAMKDYNFLAQYGVDPREELTRCLLEQIPEGALVIGDQLLVTGVLRGLAEYSPQHAKRIEQIIASTRDLLSPFRTSPVFRWKIKCGYSPQMILQMFLARSSKKDLNFFPRSLAVDLYHMMSSADCAQEEEIRERFRQYGQIKMAAMMLLLRCLQVFEKKYGR